MILLTQKAAAKECSMSEAEFTKAVASGELPGPVTILGKKFWATHAIQRHLDGMSVQSSWRDSFIRKLEEA